MRTAGLLQQRVQSLLPAPCTRVRRLHPASTSPLLAARRWVPRSHSAAAVSGSSHGAEEVSKAEELKQTAILWFTHLRVALRTLRAWIASCIAALPHISSISPQQALQRTALVLGASLLLIVIVSTIDGLMLQLYLLGARRMA